MKSGLALACLALLSTEAYSAHLRPHQHGHKYLGLDSLSPLQTAQLMSGDWTAILPESIRAATKGLMGS